MAKLFLDVFNLSITAGWLIAAVLLIRLIIRKRAPKWISCLLWGMVGLRLVLPFSFESAFSLVPSRETVIPESVYGEVVRPVTPPDDIPDTPVIPPEVSENDIPDMPVINTYPEEYIHSGIGIIDNKVNPIIQSTASVTENGKETNILQSVTEIASIVWVCGMAVLAVYAMINYLLLKKRISFSVPEGKDIRKSEAVGSPFILGIFRPRIYLPFGLSEETEAHVIAHERAHLKRKDHLIKPLGYAVLTLHWFNPLVWAAYILLCRDIEYACDEKVVKHMSADARKAYAEALLECGVSRSMISACPVAFGEIGVKKRVKNALNYKKPLLWVMILAVVICAAVAVLFLTSPAVKADEETSTDVSEDVSAEMSETNESEISEAEIIKITPPALLVDPLIYEYVPMPDDVITDSIDFDILIENIEKSENKAAFCIVELTDKNFMQNFNDYAKSFVDLDFTIVKTIAASDSWNIEEGATVSSFEQNVYWQQGDYAVEVKFIPDFPPPFVACGAYYGVYFSEAPQGIAPVRYKYAVRNLTVPLNKRAVNNAEYRNAIYDKMQIAPGNQGGYYELCEAIVDRYFEKTDLDTHTHSFYSKWYIGSDTHWQICTCDEKVNIAEHTFTDWIAISEYTEKRHCTVCGYSLQREIVDDYIGATLGVVIENQWYTQEELDELFIPQGLYEQQMATEWYDRHVKAYYYFDAHFADKFFTYTQYAKYDEMFMGTETAALGHLLEYYDISFEEYIGFFTGNEYARIMSLGSHSTNLTSNIPTYAAFYPMFHREAWYREDFWNHEDFKSYAEWYSPSEIQDYYTSLADRGGYTKYYYIIDRILIEYVGVDAFNAWLDSVEDKDQNIVEFIEYFEITRETYDSLCEEHHITPYNPDYLFGTPEMQDEYFKVHPIN